MFFTVCVAVEQGTASKIFLVMYVSARTMQNIYEVYTMSKENYNQAKAKRAAEKAVKAFNNSDSIRQDPSGSYTGSPKNRGEKPEQDADDL